MTADFSSRLTARCREIQSHLCVGFDPRVDRIPSEFLEGRSLPDAIEAFGTQLIELIGGQCAAIKFQSAFFEIHGARGLVAMENLASHARSRGMITIADIKRGDIGSTAEAYAIASLGRSFEDTPFDSITVNPWFGSDGVRPFFERARDTGKGVFVLVRTSNPSSAELLELGLENSGDRSMGPSRAW